MEPGFLLERFAEMAEADELLRTRQPWKAAHATTPGSAPR